MIGAKYILVQLVRVEAARAATTEKLATAQKEAKQKILVTKE